VKRWLRLAVVVYIIVGATLALAATTWDPNFAIDTPILPSLTAYFPVSNQKTTIQMSIRSELQTYYPVSRTLREIPAAISASLLALSLVNETQLKTENPVGAELYWFLLTLPTENRTLVLELPTTAYARKSHAVTVKVVDPSTNNIDSTVYGTAEVYVNGTLYATVQIENGTGMFKLEMNLPGTYELNATLVSGAGGWSLNMPSYIVQPTHYLINVKVLPRPVKINVAKYKFNWLNTTHVAIEITGSILDVLDGVTITNGTIDIYVKKSRQSWMHIVSIPVSSGGFSWNGVVDPAQDAELRIVYTPSDPAWNTVEVTLSLVSAAADTRGNLGGTAHPILPPTTSLLAVAAAILATLVAAKKLKREQ
jgi:hypothetical protein